jgi:hypothetical protein
VAPTTNPETTTMHKVLGTIGATLAVVAVSIPILNEAGVPQISPANTYVGLTTGDRQSVLGTYSIDENGDTTLTDTR